jgi:hypothetical protein
MPTPNPVLARRVLEHIEAHPETWRQRDWARKTECGTAYCFAGHVVRALHPDAVYLFREYDDTALRVDLPGAGERSIRSIALAALGLTEYGADVLFEATNRLEHLREYVTQLEQPDADGDLVCVNEGFYDQDDDEDYDDRDYYEGEDYQ